jgi:polyisoprenoid-binding protein YceI
MKKIHLILPLLAVFIAFKPLETVVWTGDTMHSGLGFSIVHLGVNDLKGTVKITKATITTTEEGFAGGVVSLEADMRTIDTDNDKRDTHLQSPDFFDVVKFPTLTFQSTSFIKLNDDRYSLTGNLSLHGITKPVTLTVSIKSGINLTNNKPITGLKVTGTIKRTDFDISSSTPTGIISDEVNIEANMEFSKP